jgi:phosphatidylinositol alpha-mannosyltransferase
MRILVTTPYDLAVPGGVNRHALDLVTELGARGHRVRLVGPASQPVLMNRPEVVRLGRVWRSRWNGAVTRITLDLLIAARVRRLLREFRPDVIHLQEPFLPALNTLVLLQAGRIRTVGTFHTYSETSRGYAWSWPWCHWINGQLDAHVTVSQAARAFVSQYHAAPYVIVPHGIRQHHGPVLGAPAAADAPLRILFVGRAGEPRKGFAVLVQALRLLQQAGGDRFRLTVVGPDRIEAEGLPIEQRGQLDDAALHAAYTKADVVVVPSTGGESFGLVALEALAHGVPVIASRIAGYAEWLQGERACILVPPSDAAALARAVQTFAAAVDRPSRRAAAWELARRYDLSVMTDRLVRIYQGGRGLD